MGENLLHIGVDIGSTTIKVVILDHKQKIVFSDYQRHFAYILKTHNKILDAAKSLIQSRPFTMMMTGSGGMSLTKHLNLSFIQEVVAATTVTKLYYKEVDVAIDYDPGASEVNQLNRIKLMVSAAFENMPIETEFEVYPKIKKEIKEVKGLITT